MFPSRSAQRSAFDCSHGVSDSSRPFWSKPHEVSLVKNQPPLVLLMIPHIFHFMSLRMSIVLISPFITETPSRLFQSWAILLEGRQPILELRPILNQMRAGYASSKSRFWGSSTLYLRWPQCSRPNLTKSMVCFLDISVNINIMGYREDGMRNATPRQTHYLCYSGNHHAANDLQVLAKITFIQHDFYPFPHL